MGFWEKLKKIYMGDVFGSAISEADEAFFDDLEEMLILADVGMESATEAVKELRQTMIEDKISGQEPVKAALREILARRLSVGDAALNLSTRPSVILVVGVNGVGKTTSIGKLANNLRQQGKRVLLCAGDTFRAAAADQLEIWANRSRCEIVRQKEGADPGAVLFDALQAAKARSVDVVICDTAGRLHNKANLMAELGKLKKIIDRELPEAAVETLLALDATTGQNGLIQAKQFKEITGCTGIILTKLDGTAKGGIVVAIAQELQVPVKFVGLGEGINDMQPFDAKEYVEALI
ncbi:MAG: signal recognition particle-docking protein FtsY [Oscillospiraceae bacterium]|jgi:fused signal recognition particle receptor|nr:signal recognition particle-docking protein FtsY [Oscillospiraceae bacterium]